MIAPTDAPPGPPDLPPPLPTGAGVDAVPDEDSWYQTRPIGEILVAEGHISRADLERALAFQRTYGGRLGAILVRLGALAENRLVGALARQLGMPVAQAGGLPGEAGPFLAAIERSGVHAGWWLDQEALPWLDRDGAVHCIARDPLGSLLQETLEAAFDPPARLHLAMAQDLDRALDMVQEALAGGPQQPADTVDQLRELAEQAPVVELVNNLFARAVNENASDIHIEPEERAFRVRFRIDGVLQTRLTLPRERFDAVASRIKLVSGLDIAERRLPQDGRMSTRISGRELDVRVSALPVTWGESLVIRLLPKERQQFRLDRLGMAEDHHAAWQRWAREPHGIVLITGPTGSGKSTTLYATLEEINDGSAKIVTIEEPVEYNIPGVNQVQAHADIGYTFARALRAILRQDPDKIMVGEIRDRETAEIAVQAALTGHMVFSTLHTNDALSAFTRLTDMGVEPFLVASSVRAIMAQRLVRRLCAACAVAADPDPDSLAAVAPVVGDRPGRWQRAVGCPDCGGTGYRGRLGIYELASVGPGVHAAVLRRATTQELEVIARAEGYRSLREDGLLKAWAGDTSVEEVLRVTGLVSE